MPHRNITRTYIENIKLTRFLEQHGEIGFASTIGGEYTKHLILYAASYFESEIMQHIKDFAHSASGGDEKIVSIISRKALSRQYHTFFDWDKKKAEPFFALFGEELKAEFKAEHRENEKLKEYTSSFMDIGSERNRIIHQNYARYSCEYTSIEIHKKFIYGIQFLKYIKSKLPLSPLTPPTSEATVPAERHAPTS